MKHVIRSLTSRIRFTRRLAHSYSKTSLSASEPLSPSSPEGVIQAQNQQSWIRHRCLVDLDILTNRDRLIEWFCDNVVYQDDYIVALNKLPGTPTYGRLQEDNPAEISYNQESAGHCKPVSIASIIPELQECLHCTELDVGLKNPSMQSGIVILTKSVIAKQHLLKSVRTGHVQKQGFFTNLLVSVQVPSFLQPHPETWYFTQQKIGNKFMGLHIDKPSKKARVRGDTIQIVFHVRTLSEDLKLKAALMEVKVNRDKWDCVRVFMTKKMCAVLGDHLYSGRVKPIFGVPILVEPSIASTDRQVLPKGIMHRLQIHCEDIPSLPLHLHRYKVELAGLTPQKSGPLLITAPLPSYFQATLDMLGLNCDLDDQNDLEVDDKSS